MRATIVPADQLIRRDNDAANLPDWPFDDDHIHAIQWFGQEGEIEFTGNPKPPNEITGDLTILQPYLDALDAYLEANVQPLAPDPSPQPPTANYYAFWDALITSSVYASIRTQSMASLPMNTLATEFIALIGDAKAGRPNTAAIQASISAILTTGTFTEDDIEEFQAALAAGNLAGVYELT